MQEIKDSNYGEVIQRYNSVVMLDNNGQPSTPYRKINRIPFGEYVPLVSDIPGLKNAAENFLGEFLNEISKGEHQTFFEHDKIDIIPFICYETNFSGFVANAVYHNNKTSNLAKGSILLGLSNDGWFGSTHQPYQHVFDSVLRSVENRLPLVHVVNNGPSIVVLPSGRILFESEFERAGGYVVGVPHSKSKSMSFYSQYPFLFIYSFYLLLLGIIAKLVINRTVNRET